MTTTPRVDLGALLDRSRAVITSLQEPNGAYPASPSFSAYRGSSGCTAIAVSPSIVSSRVVATTRCGCESSIEP